MKIVVLKLTLYDDKGKKKAMTGVSEFEKVVLISMDKDMKLTVVGDMDPVKLTQKLRKLCRDVEMISVGDINPVRLTEKLRKLFTAAMVSVDPAKEKKDDKKKKEDDRKKEDDKKKKQDDNKKAEKK